MDGPLLLLHGDGANLVYDLSSPQDIWTSLDECTFTWEEHHTCVTQPVYIYDWHCVRQLMTFFLEPRLVVSPKSMNHTTVD